MRERTALDDGITSFKNIERELNDNIEMIELAEMEDDQEIIAEAEKALAQLKKRAAELELESLLSGEADANDC